MGSPDAVLGESTTQQHDMASSLPHFSDDAALKVFVTVGSTRFDDLIKATGLSKPFLERLAAASACLQPAEQRHDGVQVHVIAQYGTSDIASILVESSLADQDDPSTIAQPTPTREDPTPALGQTGKLNLTISSDGSPGASLVESLVVNGFVSVQRERDVKISLFKFAPDLRSYMLQADLVVSHAGESCFPQTGGQLHLTTGALLHRLWDDSGGLALAERPRRPEAAAGDRAQLHPHGQPPGRARPRASRRRVRRAVLPRRRRTVSSPALCAFLPTSEGCTDAQRSSRSIDAVAASAVEQLQASESQLQPFPAPDARRLAALVDEEMGF